MGVATTALQRAMQQRDPVVAARAHRMMRAILRTNLGDTPSDGNEAEAAQGPLVGQLSLRAHGP
eukprot:521906-Alexandrium_andersonii.AAC.1